MWHYLSAVKRQVVAKMLSARAGEMALETLLHLCAVVVTSPLLPCKAAPGAAALMSLLLPISAMWWLKNMSNFQLELILW